MSETTVDNGAPSKPALTGVLAKIQAVKLLPKILSMLVYGKSGTGKTTFAGSWPKPILVLDVNERGTDPLTGHDGIDRVPVESWQDLEDLYWHIKSQGYYKTVVIDQVSSMQDLACAQAMLDKGKEQMSQQLWGIAGNYMKTWLVNYRNLTDDDINVLFIAHDRTSKGGDESEDDQIDPSVGPRLMPSVASLLCGAVKVIANTFIREVYDEDKNRKVEFCQRMAPHPYFITKMRNPLGTTLPDHVVDATYDMVMSLMSSGQQSKIVRRKVNESQS